MLIFLLVVSNTLYDTEYSFNHQILVPLSIILLISILITSGARLKISVICFLSLIIFLGFFDALATGRLIAIYHALVATCFFLALSCSKYLHKTSIAKLWFVPISIGLVLNLEIIEGSGLLVNKNWASMTSFYLLALSENNKKKHFFLFLAIASLLLGSRGGTIVSTFAFILMFVNAGKSIYVRYLLSAALAVFIVSCFIFLDFYLKNLWLYKVFYSDGAGLGGRDVALLLGYKELLDTLFLGRGLGFEGSFPDTLLGSARGDVYIHFGALDLMLKFSVFGFFLVLFMVISSLLKASNQIFPLLYAAVLSMFFYNGFGISHFGLNFLLYVIVGLGLNGNALDNFPGSRKVSGAFNIEGRANNC
ncbi:MAG: hypothetical protein ACX933_01655 [Marinobacter adhaerens]